MALIYTITPNKETKTMLIAIAQLINMLETLTEIERENEPLDVYPVMDIFLSDLEKSGLGAYELHHDTIESPFKINWHIFKDLELAKKIMNEDVSHYFYPNIQKVDLLKRLLDDLSLRECLELTDEHRFTDETYLNLLRFYHVFNFKPQNGHNPFEEWACLINEIIPMDDVSKSIPDLYHLLRKEKLISTEVTDETVIYITACLMIKSKYIHHCYCLETEEYKND